MYTVETKVKSYGYVATYSLYNISCFILSTLVEIWSTSIIKIYEYNLKGLLKGVVLPNVLRYSHIMSA